MKKLIGLVFTIITVGTSQPAAVDKVNFSHLNSLVQEISLDGRKVGIVHIYADFPSYAWVDAGNEGIACVDDAARAAVVYLRSFELRRDTASLARARMLLNFVVAMQTEDGQSYNFLQKDLSINREGRTSVKSFGWWAGRAVWAMALGCRVMKPVDPQFASSLETQVRRALPNVEALLSHYGRTKSVRGFAIPEWLMYESGSDATAELLLGLIEYYRATDDAQVRMYIRKLAEGMMIMQDGDGRTFPFGAHRSWETLWHSWGNSQSYALAYAGKVLGDPAMIASAEREANGFYTRLLIDGMMKEWDFANPADKKGYEQIAYGIRPAAVGLLRLYDATGNETYLKMAGLFASWFFGNNPVRATMYDAVTGRCYDGITDSAFVNRNSGAESTIEALYTLLEIGQYPGAEKYATYRKIDKESGGNRLEAKFADGAGNLLLLTLDMDKGLVRTSEVKGAN